VEALSALPTNPSPGSALRGKKLRPSNVNFVPTPLLSQMSKYGVSNLHPQNAVSRIFYSTVTLNIFDLSTQRYDAFIYSSLKCINAGSLMKIHLVFFKTRCC